MANEFGAWTRMPAARLAELQAWIAVLKDEIERRRRCPDTVSLLSTDERKMLQSLIRAA